MSGIVPLRQMLAVSSRRTTRIVPLPPAATGWNTRDTLDTMAPTDAVILDNWYPDNNGLTIRKGTASYATGLGSGAVETLAEYFAGTSRKFLAAANNAVYDISSAGAVGAAIASGFANNRWQTTNFKSKQFWCNGSDDVQVYDGATMTGAGFTGPPTKPIGVFVFKTRLFFWEAASLSFWYPATANAITGALTEFDLSTVVDNGGYIALITSFSHDGGDGVNDYLIVVMSTGETLIYLGTDPGTADTWGLSGRYQIAVPVNIRSAARYGADCYITTYDDHMPLQNELVALKEGRVPPRSKISGAVQSAFSANPSAFGWQALFYPKGRRLIFNIPNADNVTFNQHVYNTSQQAWCQFTGMLAYTWGLYRDNLYFGSSGGTVFQADTGNTDGVSAINADGQQAWSRLKNANRKRVAAARALLQTTGQVTYNFGIGFDFQTPSVANASSTSPVTPAWDVALWDVSFWSSETRTDSRWHAIGGTGTSVSMRVKVAANQAVSWTRSDLLVEGGNAL